MAQQLGKSRRRVIVVAGHTEEDFERETAKLGAIKANDLVIGVRRFCGG